MIVPTSPNSTPTLTKADFSSDPQQLVVLSGNLLFDGFMPYEMASLLACLQARLVAYQKNEAIILAGSHFSNIGILLSGHLQIHKEDINGNSFLVRNIKSGESFGEALVGGQVEILPYSIWSKAPSQVIWIHYEKILSLCPNTCSFHSRMIKNMILLLSHNLISTTQKVTILQKNTLREKLMAYFDFAAEKANSSSFILDLNRQNLANYLGVNRSAMCRELSKMQKEGILILNKQYVQMLLSQNQLD